MGLENTPITNTTRTTTRDAAEEVFVSTATAIISATNNPYLVLVATSTKHPLPILPGGKIEVSECNDDMCKAALSCIIREVKEEINGDIKNPRLIGKATDPDRDIRIVPVSKLSGAVFLPQLPVGVDEDFEVQAHYGCPDYIFVGKINESQIRETEELKKLTFINILNIKPGSLSAGHDLIVIAYREMLNSCQDKLPDNALQSFSSELQRYRRLECDNK